MKPALLLLPGTLCDDRIFTSLKRRLKLVADVSVADFRHFRDGREFCDRLLDQMPERFSVAGFSLGGLLALELLRRAPHRIERIALIASNARAGGISAFRKARALRNHWNIGGPVRVVRFLEHSYFYHEIHRRRYADLISEMARSTSRHTAFAQFDWAARRPDSHAALAAFSGPVLVASGAKDRLCPQSWQRTVIEVCRRVTWVELPRVGHFVPLEAAALLGNATVAWIQTRVEEG